MEARILDLEHEVTDLRVFNASLSKSVEHLSTNVEKLGVVVQELRDTMNQGRGALWPIAGALSLASAALATWVTNWVSK